MVKARLAVVLLLAAAAHAQRPAATVSADRVLISLPETVLKDARVRSRLDSALTTTFLVKTSLGTAARIEIRYDLWDEVYRVRRNDAAQQTLANMAQLEQWWRTPLDAGHARDLHAVDVELIVLPFSAAEENDARQWLSKSGGAGGPSPDARSVVDVLIGTTLSARPIVSYRWTVAIR